MQSKYVDIREMMIEDYDALIVLFKETPGITVRDADSRESTKKYLERNPGLSFAAETDDEIIGCVMCGHDGRRGYLQHLVVKDQFREQGIGQRLVEKAIKALADIGILKTHLFVLSDNKIGNEFWQNRGWKLRGDICTYSYINSENKNVE